MTRTNRNRILTPRIVNTCVYTRRWALYTTCAAGLCVRPAVYFMVNIAHTTAVGDVKIALDGRTHDRKSRLRTRAHTCSSHSYFRLGPGVCVRIRVSDAFTPDPDDCWWFASSRRMNCPKMCLVTAVTAHLARHCENNELRRPKHLCLQLRPDVGLR